jgi:hypothetical protein
MLELLLSITNKWMGLVEQNIPQQNDENSVPGTQSAEDFWTFVKRMCSNNQWLMREADYEHAVIEFAVDGSRTQTLFIFNMDNDLEFSIPSFAAFDSLEKVPHFISSSLMQINAKTKIGFWCLEQIGEKLVYTYMHNAVMSKLDEADFKEIVTTLITRVEDFENLLIKMSAIPNPETEKTQQQE